MPPLQGVCAWCHPDPDPGSNLHSPASRAADAIGELVTNYPTSSGPTSTLHLTEADGTRHTVPLDPGHVGWLVDLVENILRDHGPDADPDLCPHCGRLTEEEDDPFAPDPSLLY